MRNEIPALQGMIGLVVAVVGHAFAVMTVQSGLVATLPARHRLRRRLGGWLVGREAIHKK